MEKNKESQRTRKNKKRNGHTLASLGEVECVSRVGRVLLQLGQEHLPVPREPLARLVLVVLAVLENPRLCVYVRVCECVSVCACV